MAVATRDGFDDVGWVKWETIDSTEDLAKLGGNIDWHDTDLVAFYGTLKNARWFPPDVSRSGYDEQNVHLLYRVYTDKRFLEVVLIHCSVFTSRFLKGPSRRNGRIDTLKRVEVDDAGVTVMRCARVAYRFWDGFPEDGLFAAIEAEGTI